MKHRLELPTAAVDLVVAVALAQGQTNRIQAAALDIRALLSTRFAKIRQCEALLISVHQDIAGDRDSTD